MTNRPLKEFSCGSVKAAVWENQTPYGPKCSVVFKKVWKDKSEVWQENYSFGIRDMPSLIWCAVKAFDFVVEHQRQVRHYERKYGDRSSIATPDADESYKEHPSIKHEDAGEDSETDQQLDQYDDEAPYDDLDTDDDDQVAA